MESYRLPNINAPDMKGQMDQMHAYLRQLVDDMNFNIQASEEAAQKQREEEEKNQEEPFAAIRCYPVGSLYISTVSTDPKVLFGGKWEQLKDRFLLAAGDTYQGGSVGGEADVRLKEEEIPVHNHSIRYGLMEVYEQKNTGTYVMQEIGTAVKNTTSAGDGLAHNNMPPYLAVYVWKRIA